MTKGPREFRRDIWRQQREVCVEEAGRKEDCYEEIIYNPGFREKSIIFTVAGVVGKTDTQRCLCPNPRIPENLLYGKKHFGRCN